MGKKRKTESNRFRNEVSMAQKLSVVKEEVKKQQKEKTIPNKKKWLWLGVILIILMIGLYCKYNENFIYNSYESLYTTEWKESGKYIQNGEQLIRYTGNGAEAVDAKGNILWNITYEMKNPMVACCGDMVAIAERNGRQLLISTGTGTVQRDTMLYPICNVAIAEQGVTAVMMRGEEEDYIHLYDKNGNLLYEIGTAVANDGFPQALALSEDGTKMVTSYLAVKEEHLTSHITFYNFSNVGENYIRNIVGQVQYLDCLVPRLTFLNNDTICIFLENGFELFTMQEVPTELEKVIFSEPIRSIAVGEYMAFVLENHTGNDTNHIVVYDKQGKKCMDITNSYAYDEIRIAEQEIVLHNSLSCMAIRLNGSMKFQYEFDSNIRAFFPIKGNRYFLVDHNAVCTVSLKKIKEAE